VSTIGGVVALLIPAEPAMSADDPFPQRDVRNKRSRIEIRVVLALVALVLVIGGLWVMVNGSPTAHRRNLDSPNMVPADSVEAAASRQ
jgi:hypothetical protein